PSAAQRPPTEKLLVVDDDPLVLKFVAGTLERAGYRVHAAGGGGAALRPHAAAPADPFPLILSPRKMPRGARVPAAPRLPSGAGLARRPARRGVRSPIARRTA